MTETKCTLNEDFLEQMSKSSVIWLSATQVAEMLTYEACVRVLEYAMPQVSQGEAVMPFRTSMAIPGKGLFGMMPGALTADPGVFGIKLLSLYPDNAANNLPSHLGLFVLFSIDTGLPLAIMSGSVLTAIRTGGASALASKYLARTDAKILTIIGTGEQAQSHIAALTLVRDIKEIRIWGRNRHHAERLASLYADDIHRKVIVADKIKTAIKDSHIICTVTAATDPLLYGEWLEPGMHLNVVGSGYPHKAEVDSDCIRRARVYIDYEASALAQAGDLIRAFEAGTIAADHIICEIGSLILNSKLGRLSDDDITLYKSVGIAAQDLAVARYVFDQANQRGVGTIVGI
ncbi:ornithine cyclodeaminase family protein [Kineobactrum salinum]|uniref:Ornithine cyclodeaminase family protein n=1 Tax=Kineobactrum salinum TaxID=2708301 RepID=A0A6C0U3Y5_9GAMM|nr:ornithine cyclodeaminase family protein [Kineobactrum salinum]QIB66119.1 ornithine cyclodeaminase family protein [Kineobactrum salinum]